MKKNTVIIDYGVGNIKSISNAINKCGSEFILSKNYEEIINADQIILPGVGAFGESMKKLKHYNLDKAILDASNKKIKLLGICLGMQFFFERSFEFGEHKGLGLIKGDVRKLSNNSSEQQQKLLPNIGWQKLSLNSFTAEQSKFSDEILFDNYFYFVHSFAASSVDKEIFFTTSSYYDLQFISFFNSGHITGCQFHPEKSGDGGLKLLKNWLNI